MVEDDVADKQVFASLYNELQSLNLLNEPPILRAGKWNECIVFNGKKMKQFLSLLFVTPIDRLTDQYVMQDISGTEI